MKTKYNTQWINQTAKAIYESVVPFNSQYSMEKAMKQAIARAKQLIYAEQHPELYKITEKDIIISIASFAGVNNLNSIYKGSGCYCGD